MKAFLDIENHVNQEFSKLEEKQKLKLKHLLVVESLGNTLFDAEFYFSKWRKQKDILEKHPSFAQLFGLFFIEIGALLKERTIMEINHFLDNHNDSVNINYLFNCIRNEKNKLKIEKTSWNMLNQQIQKDEKQINELKITCKDLIGYRDRFLAHSDKRNLPNRINETTELNSFLRIDEIIRVLKTILNNYITFFKLTELKTLENHVSSAYSFGFETNIDDLINVVEQSFEQNEFKKNEIQKIADEFKLMSKYKF